MKTFKQILKEFTPPEEEDGGDHNHGYTLGPMTHLYLHNIEGEKTGHIGFMTTPEGHAVSVHHNKSGQEHGNPMTHAPDDDMDEPVGGHTTVHSVFRNGKHIGNLYVHYNHYYGHGMTFVGNKEGNHPRETADMRPSLKSMKEYRKNWSVDDEMKDINPTDKKSLSRLAEAHRSMAEQNFSSLIKKMY
jgi:hypothetical protein